MTEQHDISVIFVPETSPGKGTGHIKRCIGFAQHPRIRTLACFVLPPAHRQRMVQSFPELEGFACHDSLDDLPQLNGALVVLDKPYLSVAEVQNCLGAFRVVALDSLGPGLEYVPLLIDLLPRLKKGHPLSWSLPNRYLPQILFPETGMTPDTPPSGPVSIAVSFGGEDPAGLRGALLDSGLLQEFFPHARVDFIRGPASPALGRTLPEGWQEAGPFTNLADRLSGYDLLITSFGLTALEARARKVPQIHFNPSRYHNQLSMQEGFATLGVRSPGRGARAILSDMAQNLPGFRDARSAGLPSAAPVSGSAGESMDFALLMDRMVQGSSHHCPACHGTGNKVMDRQAERSFFSCGTCGITYQALLGQQSVQYGETYFFDEYKAQYGKTYLEDFKHIKAMGKDRVGQIRGLSGPGSLSLLDIGCAYGPFMDAARDGGFDPRGCDINPHAVAWVRDTLGMQAWNLDFRHPEAPLDPLVYDVVTLWYVIEHFEDLEPVLHRLSTLVRPGGILAFSTPSGQGISARARRHDFLSKSPRDHYTIWNPSQASRLLARHGFRVVKIRSTGHHPERFPGLFGTRFFRPLSRLASRVFGLGDTFELYACRMAALDLQSPDTPGASS